MDYKEGITIRFPQVSTALAARIVWIFPKKFAYCRKVRKEKEFAKLFRKWLSSTEMFNKKSFEKQWTIGGKFGNVYVLL